MKEVNIISKVVGRSGAEASASSAAIIPNMSGYATKTELNTLRDEFKDFLEGADADVIINKWQELVEFLDGISEDFDLLSMLGLKADKTELGNYVTIATEQAISGKKDFLNGLSIGGLPITKSQDDVIYLDANLVVRGGITMYAENEVNIPSILDSLPIASNTALGIASFDSTYFSVDSNGMVSLTSAPSSGASSLGELLNVDASIDATASVDRVLYQPAGSATWTWKTLSEIQSSASSTVLKVSEQAMTENVNIRGGYTGLQLLYNVSSGTFGEIGRYDAVLNVAGSSRGFQLRSVKDRSNFYVRSVTSEGFTSWNEILHSGNYSSYALPLSGGTLNGTLFVNDSTVSTIRLNTTNTDCGISFKTANSSSNRGWIGFSNQYGVSLYNYNSKSYGFAMYDNGNVALCHDKGNVGIGTTNPATKLEVNGGFGVTGYTWFQQLGEGYTLGSSRNSAYLPSGTVVYVGSLDNNVSSASLINFDTKSINMGTNGVFIGGVDSGLSNGASNFVIGRRTGTSTWAESLRIDANGNVGIGITSPSQKLHVEGYVRIGENFIASGSIGFNRNTVVGGRFNNSYNGWQFHIDTSNSRFYVYTEGTNSGLKAYWDTSGNYLVYGGITMYSDQRKKTILNHVELSLKQIADAPLIQHYYNSDQNKTTHVGSIAQYWASLNDWFCKLDAEGFYTMEIQNAALASAISIARHLEKYESKTDKKIRQLKKRISQLEDELELLKKGV